MTAAKDDSAIHMSLSRWNAAVVPNTDPRRMAMTPSLATSGRKRVRTYSLMVSGISGLNGGHILGANNGCLQACEVCSGAAIVFTPIVVHRDLYGVDGARKNQRQYSIVCRGIVDIQG